MAWLIPICIVAAFSAKGISLYFARIQIIEVGARIAAEIQEQLANNILLADVQTIENKHSGKYCLKYYF